MLAAACSVPTLDGGGCVATLAKACCLLRCGDCPPCRDSDRFPEMQRWRAEVAAAEQALAGLLPTFRKQLQISSLQVGYMVVLKWLQLGGFWHPYVAGAHPMQQHASAPRAPLPLPLSNTCPRPPPALP